MARAPLYSDAAAGPGALGPRHLTWTPTRRYFWRNGRLERLLDQVL